MNEIVGVERLGPPEVVLTKLLPPPERDQTVARGRLLERLRADPGVRLTIVAAPAGYGKTTLVGAWRELEAMVKPVAWVTLDEGDNDPVVLWSHALAALRQVCPDLAMSVRPEVIGPTRLVELVLSRLVNELTEHGDVALILDDFHRLSSGPARDSVAWFVEHAPSTFQLVLTSRSEPGLRLGALRAHGELLELRARDLAFTPDEADVLLNGRLKLGLAPHDVGDLVARTEGWPAGLYLAALSLQGAEDRHAFVRTFEGGNRHVVDFLVDEVLEATEPAMQTLMLRCSILEGLCGPLCDAVLEEEGATDFLAALARTNLFLVPLDARGEWYRFHHLFAQLLRVELEHREPGLAPTLHQRASTWHRDHGSRDKAIEHAIEAGTFDVAGELIASSWGHYANACRYTTVLAWLERFPDGVLSTNALLLLTKAWVLSLCGRREDAAQAIAAVESLGRSAEGPLPDGFASIEASLATLRACMPWGDVGYALANARRAAELGGPVSPYRPVVCWAMGMGLYFSGDSDEADSWFAESAANAPLSEMWIVAASSLAYRSLIAGRRGRREEQAVFAEQASTLARERGIEEIDGEVPVALGMALAASEEHEEEAAPLLERGVADLRSYGQPIDLANALMCEASVLRSLGEHERTTAALTEARDLVDSCADPGVLSSWLEALERPQRRRPGTNDGTLSKRELAVLRALTGPLSERDIARELYLSHNTVHSHTRSIYRKLGVSSRSEAVRQARERRLI